MLKMYLATASLLGSLAPVAVGSCDTSSGFLACDALRNAGLGERLLDPTDSGYEPQIATWWALNARSRPYCLILPRNAQEVSTALTALVNVNDGAGDWHIAIKSGGHASTGINNIAQGVTIDLSMMNSSRYDPQTNVAQIEPGGKWKDVYANLDRYGVTAAGGRDGGVGVGGFLLGGGISYSQAQIGFSCDTIVNYEVVLGNGTIINANRTANADLWKALKGGGNNFGIVTRFDLEALPAPKLYYETRVMSNNHSNAVIDVVTGFGNLDFSQADNSIIAYYSHDSTVSSDITTTVIYANTQGQGNKTTPYSSLRSIPALYNSTVIESIAEAANNSQIAGGTRNAGVTLTFRNDPAIMRLAVKFHADFVAALKRSIDPKRFVTLLFLEPIPSYTGAISRKQGGNVLGMEDTQSNSIIWVAGVAVDGTEAELAIALAELNRMKARVKQAAKSLNGDIDLVYLNYADATQDPIGSYGSRNIQFIRDVAARYDPQGVFQTRIPGGFKVSRVA